MSALGHPRDNFNRWERPHMARGDFMWGGYAVVISHNLPKEHVGDEVYSYRGHPFWSWLWGLFGKEFPPSMERGRPIIEEQILMAGGKLFMSEKTFQDLRAKWKEPQ